jgi:hypothetical protein
VGQPWWASRVGWVLAAALLGGPGLAGAQVTPAAGTTRPDDAPSVRVGGLLFLDYTTTLDPKVTDTDGNRVTQSAFNVARAYVNVTGQLNHIFAFRVTPDIVRETGTGTSLNGSLDVRLKYGYLQVNMDDWLPRGTYARVGMIPTPWVDFEDGIYRYRFQGPTFTDREGFEPSSDVGVAFRTALPSDYGEVVAGLYNGEGYNRADPNNQKALRIRGTVRPLPAPGLWRGLRLSAYVDRDHYVQDAERNRFVAGATYEHKRINAAAVYVTLQDQTSIRVDEIDGDGFSLWATPKFPHGFEALLRYDELNPNDRDDSRKARVIGGIAWWPTMPSTSVTTAFLLNVEQVTYTDFIPARPTERRVALHMLVSF